MSREDRRNKLVKVLAAVQGRSLDGQADYILECGFDYVPYIAAKSAKRALELYKEFNNGTEKP